MLVERRGRDAVNHPDLRAEQELLMRLSGPIDASGKLTQFREVQGRLSDAAARMRFLAALAQPHVLAKGGVSAAIERLSEASLERLPVAIELTRLNLPFTEETLGFNGGTLQSLKGEYARKIFFRLKTLHVLAEINYSSMTPPERDSVLDLPPTAETLMVLQIAPESRNIPTNLFREIFDGKLGKRLEPPEDRLDRFLVETGFAEVHLRTMEARQKYGIWNSRIVKLREGFTAERPKGESAPRQLELPGLRDPGQRI